MKSDPGRFDGSESMILLSRETAEQDECSDW